jgi:hypothetical protein
MYQEGQSYFEGSDANLVDASGFGVEGYFSPVMFREELLDLCSRIACQNHQVVRKRSTIHWQIILTFVSNNLDIL